MIWLIGNKGMLGTEIARQLTDQILLKTNLLNGL